MREKLTYLLSSLASSLINMGQARPTHPKTIVLVKLDEIGDVLYTLHCMQALKNQYPEATVYVVCRSVNAPLLATIEVDHILHSLNDVPRKVDIWVDFRGDRKSLRYAFRRASYYLDRGSIRLKNMLKGRQPHEIRTNEDIIKPLLSDLVALPPLGLPESYTAHVDVTQVVRLTTEAEYVVMHIGARDPDRRWPVERFAKVIDFIFETHGLRTYLVGSQDEKELNESLVGLTQNAVNIAGETNLLELAYLIAQSHYFIGNESGPLHFAVTQKRPLIALFGQGVRNVFYPLYEDQHVIHHFKSDRDMGPGLPVQHIETSEVLPLLETHFPPTI